MTPADPAAYEWPPLTPAGYLEDALTFCRDGSLLKDATSSRARCGVNCLGVAPPDFIPRALRCACADAHHHRGSALCPLTPADPWGVDGETP